MGIERVKPSALSIVAIAFVLAAACVSLYLTQPNANDERDWTGKAIANLSIAYSGAQGVWTGFDPNDHPAVIVYKSDSGEVESLLAINYPSPGALGDATALNVGDAPFMSLSRVVDAAPDFAAEFEAIQHLDLSADLDGVDSFAIVADKDFLDPTTFDWAAIFIHEMFHRHQLFSTFDDHWGHQDFEGYPFDADNLALATLEDRALKDALAAGDGAALETAAQRFAAVRVERSRSYYRLSHDNHQERIEGTARYLEHRFAGDDARFSHHAGNYGNDLETDIDAIMRTGEVKSYYSFLRLYDSGAAILRILELLGVEGFDQAIHDGKAPAELLIQHLGISRADVERLIADARAAYDPAGELLPAARRAAAAATREGPVFDDMPSSVGEEIILTQEESRCLEENGMVEGKPVSQSLWNKCVDR